MNARFSASRRVVVLAVVSVLVLSGSIGVVAGQSTDTPSGVVVVEADETVDRIDTVAGSIVVRGTVTGDISGVAGHVHVTESGQVDGSVEAAAGAIRIDGTVAGDVSTGSGHTEITDTARIGGNLDLGTGYLLVDGQVDGDVRAGAERIALGPNAVVGGEFRYDAPSFSQDPAAIVDGGVVEDSDLGGDTSDFTVPSWLGIVYGLLANLLLGAILLAVFPSFATGVAARVVDSPARSGGIGLLLLIAVPILLVVVAISLVGIPLSLFGAAGFGAAIWIAVVLGQYAVGAWALDLVGVDNRWLALVVGLVAVALLGAIPIFGGLVDLLVLLVGLGALALGLRKQYQLHSGDQSTVVGTSAD
ncbi:bactofilin family protein [Halohasta salina]|uniref:bactofilin family protein n=1 Tax=Halohasta salina TaxID=2961621 RepID=UPI0020A339E4|nr:polymer-forming cytoskeletal protein [Halohasta salina]